jgi:hypothetical protein
MNWKHLTGLVCMASGLASAHLTDNSLVPKGGETLTIGQTVSITWGVDEIHNRGIDIAFSKDGGKTWTNVKTGYTDNQKSDKYNWTVGEGLATTQGKIRICQAGPCTDLQNTSKAGGGSSPWYLVSGALTVQAATGIAEAPASAGMSIDVNPATGNVDVSFDLAQAGTVLLQAFDMQGRLVANLIQGDYAAGAHALSVFSNRLGAEAGSLVFKLQAGGRVKTHTWLRVR